MKKVIKLSAATLVALTVVGTISPVAFASSNVSRSLKIPGNAKKVFVNTPNHIEYQTDDSASLTSDAGQQLSTPTTILQGTTRWHYASWNSVWSMGGLGLLSGGH